MTGNQNAIVFDYDDKQYGLYLTQPRNLLINNHPKQLYNAVSKYKKLQHRLLTYPWWQESFTNIFINKVCKLETIDLPNK